MRRARISMARVLCSLVQGFPGVGFVEEKIEEGSDIFLAMGLSLVAGEFPSSLCRCSEAAEESIYDGACVKQVFREPRVAAGCAGRVAEAVRARQGRSSRQGSAIYCHRARSEREAIDLSDGSPRKTLSDWPSNGWRARTTVTLSGRC